MNTRPAILVLTIGSLCGLLGVLVLPRLPLDRTDQLRTIAAQGPHFLAGTALSFGSAAILMVGFGRLAGYFGRLKLRVPAALAATAAFGWFLHTALITLNSVTYELARQPDPAEMAVVAAALYAGPVFLGLLIPMLLATLIGMIGTAVSLWRTHLAPLWLLPVVVLALVSDFVAPEEFSGVPMFVLLAVGFGALWWRAGVTATGRDSRRTRVQGPAGPASDTPAGGL